MNGPTDSTPFQLEVEQRRTDMERWEMLEELLRFGTRCPANQLMFSGIVEERIACPRWIGEHGQLHTSCEHAHEVGETVKQCHHFHLFTITSFESTRLPESYRNKVEGAMGVKRMKAKGASVWEKGSTQ